MTQSSLLPHLAGQMPAAPLFYPPRYQYFKAQQTMTKAEADYFATLLLNSHNCTLLNVTDMNDPYAYLNLLCAEG